VKARKRKKYHHIDKRVKRSLRRDNRYWVNKENQKEEEAAGKGYM